MAKMKKEPDSLFGLRISAWKAIEAARKDIAQGKLFSSKKMAKELGF